MSREVTGMSNDYTTSIAIVAINEGTKNVSEASNIVKDASQRIQINNEKMDQIIKKIEEERNNINKSAEEDRKYYSEMANRMDVMESQMDAISNAPAILHIQQEGWYDLACRIAKTIVHVISWPIRTLTG